MSGRGADCVNTIGLGYSSAKKITRGFMQLKEVVADNQIADFIPSISSLGGGGGMTMEI